MCSSFILVLRSKFYFFLRLSTSILSPNPSCFIISASKLTFINVLQVIISFWWESCTSLLTLLTYMFSTSCPNNPPKYLWIYWLINYRTHTNIWAFTRITSKFLILGGKVNMIRPASFSKLVFCRTLPHSPKSRAVSLLSLGNVSTQTDRTE